MNEKKKLIIAYLLFILIGIIITIISLFRSSSMCMFYNYTSIPCPACGMTRAFKSLLSFDIMKAFWYHPLFPLVILFPYIYVKMDKRLIYIIGTLFIVTWIIRLILLFPHTSPMVPNTSAYLYKVFMYIKGLIG